MPVKLLSNKTSGYDTLIRTMYLAARLCYSKETPEELYNNFINKTIPLKEMENFLQKHIFDTGHWSVLEHIKFTFLIWGYDRNMSKQLMRHRLNSYSERSLRYVDATNIPFIVPDSLKNNPVLEQVYSDLAEHSKNAYRIAMEQGIKKEDARSLLLGSTETCFVFTTNLRQLLHISQLRMCVRAQLPIRTMMNEIKKELDKAYKDNMFTKYMKPNCENCKEVKGCKRS